MRRRNCFDVTNGYRGDKVKVCPALGYLVWYQYKWYLRVMKKRMVG